MATKGYDEARPGRFKTDRSAGTVRLGQITIPRAGTLDLQGPEHDATAEIAYDGARLVCTSLQVKARRGGPPVTGAALRAFPMKRLLAEAMGLMARRNDGPGGLSSIGLELAQRAGDGPIEDVLRLVATLYRAVEATGGDPTATIVDFTGRPRPTISRWVVAARRFMEQEG